MNTKLVPVASADIKNTSVTGKDVEDGALTAVDLSAATVAWFKGGSGQRAFLPPSDCSTSRRHSPSGQDPTSTW